MKKIALLVVVVSVIALAGYYVQTKRSDEAVPVLLKRVPQNNRNLETDEPESYISCGCGCCGFDEPLEEIAKEECVYKSKGESIQDKIDQDKQLSPDLCVTVGCSSPIKYIYCD